MDARPGLLVACLAIAVAAVLAVPASAAAFGAYMTTGVGHSAAVFDTRFRDVVGPPVPDFGFVPTGIVVDDRARRAYSLGSFSVMVLDLDTNRIVGSPIEVGLTTGGRALALSPDGSRLYVGRAEGFSVVDTRRRRAIAFVPIQYGIAALAVSRDGSRLYAVGGGSGAGMTTYDTRTLTPITERVPTPNSATAIVLTPDGTRAYVNASAGLEETVTVVDLRANAVLTRINAGRQPADLAMDPTGRRVYTANTGDGAIGVIDVATNAVVGTIPVGQRPIVVTLTPDGRELYVSAFSGVAIIDLATSQVVARDIKVTPTGWGGIQGIAFSREDPTPMVGRLANVTPTGGQVRRRCRGERRFTPVTETEQIPVDCVVDPGTAGVRLDAAKGTRGGVQTGEFSAAQFRLAQDTKRKAITTLTLTGRLDCPASGRDASTSAGRRGRGMWGKGKGRFRTVGRRGSASARGTEWLVEDLCDGTTRFQVREGVVDVRDFERNRTLTLRAGDTYVAGTAAAGR